MSSRPDVDPGMIPPWWFPTPVRRGRFIAGDPGEERYNIEVAPDRMRAFALGRETEGEVLYYDLQTQWTGNTRGRLGSGRGGVYGGGYLKGVGRTPAAANWNEAGDLYHASGHLSVASAIRERLITGVLEARGMGDAVVPCTAVLLRRLAPAETRAIRGDESSSRPAFARADGALAALTVKPADFARPSNIAFALDHFENSPRGLGELFLELERYLDPPRDRTRLEGSPVSIAGAMDRAFRRGLDHFRGFARAGLFWIYLDSNFSLDGRFLDLETPVYFGTPWVGLAESEVGGEVVRELVGFEEFGYVRHWRVLVAGLLARLRFMTRADVLESSEARLFLRELIRSIHRTFDRSHPLHGDDALVAGAVRNLAGALGLDRRDRNRLRELARATFPGCLKGRPGRIPDCGWGAVAVPPAPATPRARRFLGAAFCPGEISADARSYADAVERLGAVTDPGVLLAAFRHPTKVGCAGDGR